MPIPTNMIIFFLLLFSIISCACQSHPPYTDTLQGNWHLLHESIGISAMHMQLLHTNGVIIFDRTDFGESNLSLPGDMCRYDPNDNALQTDCTAHSLLYDIGSNTIRPLMLQTDTWCSSGSVRPDGTFIQTGGFNDGDRVVRTFDPCIDGTCDWVEFPSYLSERRWYSSNQILPDGRIIIVGGRRQFNYEFYPKNSYDSSHFLNFLRETRDDDENNLYPFLHLLPDGNLFIFANTRSISLDYNQNRVVREFPSIPIDEPRNYPSSGSSVLLPLDQNNNNEAEIMICGGAPRHSFSEAAHRHYVRASASCGRLKVSDENPNWIIEDMPIARVMGDMLLLPTGDVIIINGAELGTAGWEYGREPVTRPLIYHPHQHLYSRFSVMAASTRPRLYHSSAILLTDGSILIGGSNPHIYYNFTGVEYPTDLSLESYSPPYLLPEYAQIRPRISSATEVLQYREPLTITIVVQEYLSASMLSARLVAPAFSTHSFGMNQRMVVLKLVGVSHLTANTYSLRVVGPSAAEVAPPGYYLLFVVHGGVPSSGVWLKLQ